MKRRLWLCAILFLGLSLAGAPAFATNGVNMIGVGAKNEGMGGAGVATLDDFNAMNKNPANLTLTGTQAGLDFAILMPRLHHKDQLGNDKDAESINYYMANVGYVKNDKKSPFVYGVGIFAQGGMGAHFKDIKTVFGTTDETYSKIEFGKLVPAVAYRATPELSVGASLGIGYSRLQAKLFPNTVVMAAGFMGFDLKTVDDMGYNGKVGVNYQVNKMVSVGAQYTTATKFTYDGGKIAVKGLGEYDAEVKGFGWPVEYGIGVGVKPIDNLTVAVDVSRMNWKNAVKTVNVVPKGAPGFTSDGYAFNLNWKNQTVYALGLDYNIMNYNIRAGYNYGKNPVPNDSMNPLFPAIQEQHLTLGFGWTTGPYTVDVGYAYGLEKEVTYTNTTGMFGSNTTTSMHQHGLHVQGIYKF